MLAGSQMRRRAFIKAIAGGAATSISIRGVSTAAARNGSMALMAQLSPSVEVAPTLLSAPIELAGDWGHMLPRSANLVVERMRHSCLYGVRLVSDRQPTRLRVDEHTSGPPAAWLHPDGCTMAQIIVHIRDPRRSQLPHPF